MMSLHYIIHMYIVHVHMRAHAYRMCGPIVKLFSFIDRSVCACMRACMICMYVCACVCVDHAVISVHVLSYTSSGLTESACLWCELCQQ